MQLRSEVADRIQPISNSSSQTFPSIMEVASANSISSLPVTGHIDHSPFRFEPFVRLITVRIRCAASRTRYTTDSITRWAVLKHGIVIREWFDQFPALTKWMLPDDVKWEDLEIRIRKDRTVSYFYKDNKEFDWDNKTLSEIDLFDMKKREPNSQAGILIGLSMGEKYPPTQKPEAKHRTAMSKLRTTLRRLTGIKTDPFYPHNVADGFKPRFKLTNDEQIANERAKSRARHVGYDDEKDYGVDDPD